MPPMSLQMTGRRWAKASWITSGAFSHQIDGTTTQSTAAIRRAWSRVHTVRDAGFGRGGQRLLEMLDRRGGLMGRAAVDGERVADARAAQARGRLQRDRRALEAVDVSEEAEPVAPPIRRGTCGGARDSRQAIADHLDATRIDAPGDEAIAQKPARRNETVHDAQRASDMQLAKADIGRGAVGQAAAA